MLQHLKYFYPAPVSAVHLPGVTSVWISTLVIITLVPALGGGRFISATAASFPLCLCHLSRRSGMFAAALLLVSGDASGFPSPFVSLFP